MTIGQLARRTGLTARAIRHYETLDLITPSGRTQANYRLYDAAAIAQLRFIANCRALGFSTTEVSALLAVMDDPRHTCSEAAALTRRHLELVDEKLRDLVETRNTLARFLERCSTPGAAQCPMLDSLAVKSVKRTGASSNRDLQ